MIGSFIVTGTVTRTKPKHAVVIRKRSTLERFIGDVIDGDVNNTLRRVGNSLSTSEHKVG